MANCSIDGTDQETIDTNC